jgi:putative ABC transport system permease protein
VKGTHVKLLLIMAWRNIWRNRRRTLLTMASIVLAIVLSVVMRSMQLGSYKKMIDDVVGTYTGHLQVHKKGYWDDKSIDNTFFAPDSLLSSLAALPGVRSVIPRFESFALAAGREHSRGSFVVGISPEKEQALSKLRDRVTKGEYLSSGDDGVLVAEGLADYLKLDVGDSLILLGQGFHGVNAAGSFRIKGIVSFASPELNRSFVYLDCGAMQRLFSAQHRLTCAVIEPVQSKLTAATAAMLRNTLDPKSFEVLTWRQMLPELVQQIGGDNAGGLIMLGILYLVVAFGIFGTVLMMTTERIREFGVVNALGVSSGNLSVMVVFETILLSLLSAAAGVVLVLPIVVYFANHPIRLTGEAATAMINFGVEPVLPMLLDAKIFLAQVVVVFLITMATVSYPLLLLRKFNPVAAMRR